MGKAGSGFKKPANKKKVSKKDIISVSAVVAVIVAIIIVFAIVVNNDDFIRTKNGRLQMDDNWLIAQYERKNGAVWYQIGEVGEIEGFSLTTESAGNSMKYIYPDDLTNNVSVIYVGSSYSTYDAMIESLSLNTALSYGITEVPETVSTTIAGRDAFMVHCVIPCEEDLAEETTEEATEETTEEVTEETTKEATEETTEEVTEETTEEVTEETTEEATEETATPHSHPGSMIYACIEYDDQRCIFIQINTVEAVTDEEAFDLVETVGAVITLIDR